MKMKFDNFEIQLLSKYIRKEDNIYKTYILKVKLFMNLIILSEKLYRLHGRYFSAFNFGSSVSSDIHTNAFKEEKVWQSLT